MRRSSGCWLLAALATLLVSTTPAAAQRGPVDGHVEIGVDHLPNVSWPGAGDDTTELRTRLFLERAWTIGRWKVRAAGLAEGLAADRDRTRRDAHLQIREATIGWSG